MLDSLLRKRLEIGYYQYTPEIVSYWDVFIDWDKRKKGEGNFFIDFLRKFKVKKILDFACGTGYDSVRLLEEGFKVKSCDGNIFMLLKARINAQNHKVNLETKICEWRRLKRIYREKFDGIICLGNSFCHLYKKEDRINVLKQVYNLLRKGGIFIVDQRNFDKILDKGFSSKHKYVYCGTQFDVKLKKKTKEYVTFLYKYKDGKFKFELDLYPIRLREMRDLLLKTGFKVLTFGDFSKKFKLYEPDFFQHICIKK